jgi:hypothetical protein
MRSTPARTLDGNKIEAVAEALVKKRLVSNMAVWTINRFDTGPHDGCGKILKISESHLAPALDHFFDITLGLLGEFVVFLGSVILWGFRLGLFVVAHAVLSHNVSRSALTNSDKRGHAPED